MLVTNAAWTLKQVRPVNLLQSLLTLFLVPQKLLNASKEALLGVAYTSLHGSHGIKVSI